MSNAPIAPPMDRGERLFTGMSAVVLDADEALARAFGEMREENDLRVTVRLGDSPSASELPQVLAGAQIAIVWRSAVTPAMVRSCPQLQHIVLLQHRESVALDVPGLEAAGVAIHVVAPADRERSPESLRALAEEALEQCRRIVVPTGG